MGCCGQKRVALTSAPATLFTRPSRNLPKGPVSPRLAGTQLPVQTQRVQSVPPLSSTTLRYTENSPVLVQGPMSGRTYRFSASTPIQTVEARDSAALLSTGFFKRVAD